MAKKTSILSDLKKEDQDKVLDLIEKYYCFLADQEPRTIFAWRKAADKNPDKTSEIIGLKRFLDQCNKPENERAVEQALKQALYKLGVATFYSFADPEISEDDPRVALK